MSQQTETEIKPASAHLTYIPDIPELVKEPIRAKFEIDRIGGGALKIEIKDRRGVLISQFTFRFEDNYFAYWNYEEGVGVSSNLDNLHESIEP